MSLKVASPVIVFSKELTEKLKEQVTTLRTDLNRIRLRSFGSIRIFRTPDENGGINVSGLNNKLHRCGVHMNYYFTNPVLVNYDNVLTKEDIDLILTKLRYVDCGRIHIVNMDTDGKYKLDLKINRNLSFETFEDIKLNDEKQIKGSNG